MILDNKGKNAKKKPFKWTRELIKLALNDGWTQSEIAEKCRTQQSIVSAWNRGSKRGTEQQLKPLLDIYGYKLRRHTFKVYWTLNTETMGKTFFRIEGKVIFAQAFYDFRRDRNGKLVKKVPEYKLVIHHQGDSQFIVIRQSRLKFSHTNEQLDHNVEDAIWSSNILCITGVAKLLEYIDKYAEQNLIQYPSDACTLPFLIRRAFLNHGIAIEGVVDYPALW